MSKEEEILAGKEQVRRWPVSHICPTNVCYLIHIMFKIWNELPAFQNWENVHENLGKWDDQAACLSYVTAVPWH